MKRSLKNWLKKQIYFTEDWLLGSGIPLNSKISPSSPYQFEWLDQSAFNQSPQLKSHALSVGLFKDFAEIDASLENQDLCLLILDGPTPIHTTWLRFKNLPAFRTHLKGPCAYRLGTQTHPQYRHQGINQWGLNLQSIKLREMGVNTLYSSIDSKNDINYHCLKKFGFEILEKIYTTKFSNKTLRWSKKIATH